MDRIDGRRVWTWSLPGAAWRRLVVTDDRVYVLGLPQWLVCLAYATGDVVWNVVPPLGATTLLLDGTQLVAAGSGEVACFSAEDGRLSWHDDFKGMGLGGVAVGFPHNSVSVDVGG
jgi:outer membrane protein assembly factor BamB